MVLLLICLHVTDWDTLRSLKELMGTAILIYPWLIPTVIPSLLLMTEKKLFHASSTPTVMTATWGTGSQIIDLCEQMGLSIHESQRATENQRNVSMWAHQHSSDYFLWLNREWLSKNLSFWFLTTLLTSQFSNFCLKIGLPFNLFISRSWMGQAIISPPGAWTGIWAFPTPLRHWWVLAHSNLLEVSLDNHKHLRGNQESGDVHV